jgi:serine/threonine protein kinase
MGSFTPPPTIALVPGDHLDRYELLCVLAQGGMGTVWLARMTGKLGFERLVALKTILPTYSNDRLFCDMFLDEAKIAGQIDHENVARILEIGEDRGLLYYAMELIDGESLRKVYRDVRAAKMVFPMGVAMRIVADACAGLHATHELHGEDGQPLQVVHRDVSPQNLLVTIRGTTKLIDFGVAKANARRSEETAAGTLKGKIEYMAPEQARGEPLDRRADVYALGAVLYELLAGRPVRDTDEGRQLAALHELMTGVPYAPLPASVPHLVRGIVDRALARDPAMRFATAEELRRALEQAMLATGEASTPEDVANVLAHFSRERTAKRKDAIERALRAATDGRLNAATIVAPLSAARALPSYGSAPGETGTGPGGTTRPGTPVSAPFTGPYMSMGPPGSATDTLQTGPSMRTIGAASMSAHPTPGSSAAKIFAGLLVLGLVALLGVVAGVIVTRRAERGGAVAASTTTAAATTASGVTVGVATIDPAPAVVPPVVLEPSLPATGVANDAATSATAHATKDAGTSTTQTSTRKPTTKPAAKPGAKPSDGDEYGF